MKQQRRSGRGFWFGLTVALGQKFYERAKDDVMTQYSTAKSGEFSRTPSTPNIPDTSDTP